MTQAQAIFRYVDSQKNWITKLCAKRQIIMLNEYLLGEDILDVGCGAGVVEAEYINTAKSITSCDIKDQNLYGLNVIKCSAEELLFEKNSFDLITMLGVVEHLDKPHIAMLEAHYVLKKRGRIIISIPNGIGWWILRNLFKTSNLHAYFNQKELYEVMSGWKLVKRGPIIRGLFWMYEYEVIK